MVELKIYRSYKYYGHLHKNNKVDMTMLKEKLNTYMNNFDGENHEMKFYFSNCLLKLNINTNS